MRTFAIPCKCISTISDLLSFLSQKGGSTEVIANGFYYLLHGLRSSYYNDGYSPSTNYLFILQNSTSLLYHKKR